MNLRMTKKRWTIVVVGVVVAVAGIVALLLYFLFMTAGGLGWRPDRQSARAVRAYAVDRHLRSGMQKAEVLKIFKADVAANPDDMVDETDVTFNAWERPCPSGSCKTGTGAGQFELTMFDLPHGLEGFGTAWNVRTRFDGHGRLVQHGVHMEHCCGP
jgi:hypothetical protein